MTFRPSTAKLLFFLLVAAQEAAPQSPIVVSLTPTTSPSAGQAGVTSVSITGSNFPSSPIAASSVSVNLRPASPGPSSATVTATAIAAIAGSTRRVTFTIPASIVVGTPTPYLVSISGQNTAGTAFASSNASSLTVNPAPQVSVVAPSSGITGQTLSVIITGSFTSFVQNSTRASFGAGISVGGAAVGGLGPVTVTSPTSATALITISPTAIVGSRTVLVQTGAQQAQLPAGFSVVALPPQITDFNPRTAAPGTLVTITGTNLTGDQTAMPTVMLAKRNAGTIAATVLSANSGSIGFIVPSGATTGLIMLSSAGHTVHSASPLTISGDLLSISAAPSAITVVQGKSAVLQIQMTADATFTQSAQLAVSGLPSGMTASFVPASISAGQIAVMTLTAPAGQTIGTTPIAITATANVNGIGLSPTANAQISVLAPTTSLIGRTVVSDPLETPLAGVSITMLGKDGNGDITGCSGHTISDAAGNFALLNLPQTCAGPQLVSYDGTTATAPAGKYAGVNLAYTLASGQATTPQVLIHLPRIDNQETFLVKQKALVDQSYSFSTIPHLSVIVYAGTTFTMPDGTQPDPFPLAAINVPVDRLPDVKPPVPTMITAFIVAFQPANATASQPVAVYYPNTLNTAPGVNMALLTLDPTHGAMVPYGTGAVSADGTQIIPDLDPSHPGHRYGLVHFDWHMPGSPGKNQSDPCSTGPVACIGDPIDVSSGLEVYNETDISFGGARGRVALTRTFRNGVQALQTNEGPFGFGTNHNYGYELGVVTPSGSAVIPLITPNGSQFPFSLQPDGTYANSSGIPSLAGATMSVQGNQDVALRWKDGTVFHFSQMFVVPVIRNLLTSITDANGNVTQILRSGFQITQIVDPVGRALTFTNNSDGTIAKVTGPDGRSVSYSYGIGAFVGNGNRSIVIGAVLTQVTHLDGTTTTYEYDGDAHGNLTKVIDGRGVVVAANTYDANNRVVQQVQANGGVLKFAYTLQNPTAEISPVMTTTVTDALGNQTIYRFSPTGAVLSATDPLGQTRVFGRDANNNVTAFSGNGVCGACGDPRSGDLSVSYDTSGNLLSLSDSLGNTTRLTYDAVFNRVTSVTDPLGHQTTATYDFRGNPLSLTDPNGNTTAYRYDPYGELTTVTDATGHTSTFSYDGSGNVVAIVDPLGDTTTFGYDIVGRLISTKDALGRVTRIAYDRADRITEIDNAQGFPTNFSYDEVGNLLSVITGLRPCPASGCDPNMNVSKTAFTYDSMNALLTRTDPLGRTDTRTYDANENLIKFEDRRGQASFFSYDLANRLTQETYDDSTVFRSYDGASRLSTVSDSASGKFNFTWNASGMLLQETSPTGVSRYERDGLGRATSRQVVGQAAITYAYDPAGNLLSAALPQASATLTYDARNLIAALSRQNGIVSSFDYDAADRLLKITHTNGQGTLDVEEYNYDAVGNPIGHTTSMGQALITAALSGTRYDADNEQLQFGSAANTFDANGNLLSSNTSGVATSYTWDSRNRLKSITTGAGQTTFTYDFGGNMLSQSDNGPNSSFTQSFVVDDLTNVAYQSASDGSSYSVLSGMSVDSHFGIVDGVGNVQYGLSDALNSTVVSVDKSGSVAGAFHYEPFGETSASDSYPFQFAGRQVVSASMYYNRARFYNAASGRFIEEDPISFAGLDSNLYRYVWNEPTTLVDPLGLVGMVKRGEDYLLERTQQLLDQGGGSWTQTSTWAGLGVFLAEKGIVAAEALPTPVSSFLGVVDSATDPCLSLWQKFWHGSIDVIPDIKYLRNEKTLSALYLKMGSRPTEAIHHARNLRRLLEKGNSLKDLFDGINSAQQ